MASVTQQDIPEISAFEAEFWKVKKQFWIPELNNVDYWNCLWDSLSALKKKYNHHHYVAFAVDAYAAYLQFMYEIAVRTKQEGKKD